MTKVTDYIGNKVYEQGVLKKILVDGGYIEDGKYYFTQQDHLGNTRMVLSDNGTIVQREYYYPFGMTMPQIEYDGKHPYRYNGKELDQMHRLDLYDYSARYYDQAIGRFTTVDPHAENYYSWSPYHYAANNPIRITDPTGMDWYFNQEYGSLYFIKDNTQESFKYGGTEYVRIGGNDMLGNMGDITEKIYNLDESQKLVSAKGYAINPIQQVKESSKTKISDIHNPSTRTEMAEQEVVINEKYSLMPIENRHQVRENVKVEILGNKFGIKEFIKAMGGAADQIIYTREYSTYLNSSDFEKSGKNEISVPPYGSRTTYNSWQDYYRATKGKGNMLKYRK